MIKFKLHVVLAEKRMTQQQLSDLSGVSYPAINKFCQGNSKRLDVETLDKLCDALNCSLSELIEYVPDERE